MCMFPSWIEKDGKTYFNTDAEIEAHGLDWVDGVGHSAVRKVWGPLEGGADLEGFPCPPEFAKAIRRGKCKKMMAAYGYTVLHLNDSGKLHREDGPAIEWANGDKMWWLNGKLVTAEEAGNN